MIPELVFLSFVLLFLESVIEEPSSPGLFNDRFQKKEPNPVSPVAVLSLISFLDNLTLALPWPALRHCALRFWQSSTGLH